MITAEKVYKEIVAMPVRERERLFAVIARQGLRKIFTRTRKFSVT